VSLGEWRHLYAGLYTSQIRGNTNLLYLDTINRLLSKYSYTDQPISMAVLYYNYQSIKPNAISSNLLQNVNGQLQDVAGRTESPYDTKEMFAVAPIRQAALTGSNQIIFRSDLLMGNTGKTISSIELDANGSGNWQTITFNTAVTVSYTTEGFYNVNIRITYTDGVQRVSHTKLAVYARPSGSSAKLMQKKQGSLCSADKDFFFSADAYGNNPLLPEDIPAIKPYLGVLAEGDITVEYAQSNSTGQIRKPLIVVEGFDLNDGYNYASFWGSLKFDENVRQAITLNDDLDNIAEYDIIFLNLHNATDYIQRNAFLLERVITVVNGRKTLYNGVRQQNVIIGLSMGGVIARYALKDMENTGIPHETRLFIAHDAPFKGANIPVGFQAAVQHLGPFKILGIGGQGQVFIRYDDLIPEVANLLQTFNSPAAKQLIIQRYDLNTVSGALTASNSDYTNFQNELNNLGWPANCRTAVVANGSCNGTRTFTTSNANFFTIAGDRNMNYFGALWRSLALTVGGILTPTSLLTGGPGRPQPNAFALFWEFPVTSLSTKTSIGLDFSCNAIPNSGTAQIYKGQIYSKKKVLGIFNITSNFVNLTSNSQTSMIPLDNAPGGTYDLEKFGLDPAVISAQLPNFFQGYITTTINQSAFCFVPTVSSIAHNSASSAWFDAVCGTAECTSASEIADFYLQNSNQLHISYTQANGDWIMQRQDPAFSCAKICQVGVINGIDPLCTTSTYTLTGVPSNTNVVWSLNPSNYGTVTPGVPSTSASITKTSSGIVTITAAINNSCTVNNSVSRTIRFGGYSSSDYPVSGPSFACQNQTLYFNTNTLPGATNYAWFWPSDWTYQSGQGTPYLTVSTSYGSSGAVGVRVANACDAGGSPGIKYVQVNSCGFFYSASPNPSTGDVTISTTEPGMAATAKNQNKIYKIKVVDQAGNIKRQYAYTNGVTNANISLSNLIAGVYTIQAYNGTEWSNQQVVKK